MGSLTLVHPLERFPFCWFDLSNLVVMVLVLLYFVLFCYLLVVYSFLRRDREEEVYPEGRGGGLREVAGGETLKKREKV